MSVTGRSLANDRGQGEKEKTSNEEAHDRAPIQKTKVGGPGVNTHAQSVYRLRKFLQAREKLYLLRGSMNFVSSMTSFYSKEILHSCMLFKDVERNLGSRALVASRI